MDAAILSRIEGLEAENRRWRARGGAAAVAFLGCALLGQAAGAGREIEATSVVVRDAEGKTTLRLGRGKDGSFGITLEDSSGKVRAGMRFGKGEEAEILLADAGGAPRVRAATYGGDTAGIVLSDGKGERRSWWMTVESDPVLDFFDAGGQTRLGLSHLAKSDSAGISFFNAAGATRAGMVQEKDDSMRLTFRTGPDDAERKALELRVRPDGVAGLQVSDPGDRVFALFGALPPPRGGLGTYVGTKDGKVCAALIGSGEGGVLQMGDGTGAKLAELHALAEAALPPEARGKAPPASLILYDRKGKEVLRVPAGK